MRRLRRDRPTGPAPTSPERVESFRGNGPEIGGEFPVILDALDKGAQRRLQDLGRETVEALGATEIGDDGVSDQRIRDVAIVDREIWLRGLEQYGFDLGPKQVQFVEVRIEPTDVEMHFF